MCVLFCDQGQRRLWATTVARPARGKAEQWHGDAEDGANLHAPPFAPHGMREMAKQRHTGWRTENTRTAAAMATPVVVQKQIFPGFNGVAVADVDAAVGVNHAAIVPPRRLQRTQAKEPFLLETGRRSVNNVNDAKRTRARVCDMPRRPSSTRSSVLVLCAFVVAAMHCTAVQRAMMPPITTTHRLHSFLAGRVLTWGLGLMSTMMPAQPVLGATVCDTNGGGGAALADATIVGAVDAWCAGGHTQAEVQARHGHINCWDTSTVKMMEALFEGRGDFNDDIGGWRTGAVTTTHHMFLRASAFNQDIDSWQMGVVTSTQSMFNRADRKSVV